MGRQAVLLDISNSRSVSSHLGLTLAQLVRKLPNSCCLSSSIHTNHKDYCKFAAPQVKFRAAALGLKDVDDTLLQIGSYFWGCLDFSSLHVGAYAVDNLQSSFGAKV